MKHVFTSILLLLSLGCQTPEDRVSTTLFHAKPTREPYQKTMEKYSRETTVFSNYETLYMLNGTVFSTEFYEEFRKAVNERFLELNVLKDIQENATFFVSIFSPNNEYNDLSNKRIWEFNMQVGDKTYRSKLVKQIKEKESWYAFFPYINRWSSDFVISFEIPEGESIPSDSKFTLSLANAEAKTLMVW